MYIIRNKSKIELHCFLKCSFVAQTHFFFNQKVLFSHETNSQTHFSFWIFHYLFLFLSFFQIDRSHFNWLFSTFYFCFRMHLRWFWFICWWYFVKNCFKVHTVSFFFTSSKIVHSFKRRNWIFIDKKSYQVNSIGKQWLGGCSYFTIRTAFSPGTCRSTVKVSSRNRIVSENN